MCGDGLLSNPTSLSFSSIRAVKCFLCLELCGFPLYCYFSEYLGSGLSDGRCHPSSKPVSQCCRSQGFCKGNLNQKNVLSVKIEVKPVCECINCGWSPSVLHPFDWCVYLNPRHLPHRPKEAGGYSIIRCLWSHCQAWQQSGCVFKCLYAQTLFFIFSPPISEGCGLPQACYLIKMVLRYVEHENLRQLRQEEHVSSQWKPPPKDFVELLPKPVLSLSFHFAAQGLLW